MLEAEVEPVIPLRRPAEGCVPLRHLCHSYQALNHFAVSTRKLLMEWPCRLSY